MSSKYSKPALTIEEQADLLIRRGMRGDRNRICERLCNVNYYRLSGYWLPFLVSGQDRFRDETEFEAVWDRYLFDRRLRLLTMDAIERIEVAVRAQLAYFHAHRYGPFAYINQPASTPKLTITAHANFVQRVDEEVQRSQQVFVRRFRQKYALSPHLPIWMAIEVLSFGTVLTFFRGSANQAKQSVASIFGMPHVVFGSWLLTLNTVRNICAHHGRLWNRVIGTRPMIPDIAKYPQWHSPAKILPDRMFATLTIARHCLQAIAPQSKWPTRVRELLDQSGSVPLSEMGFPANWKDYPYWK
jgi:abortive infection bacteriophage resistance protein